ncbi:MAG: hypothetical protein B6U89_00190 [Desulfurococcales archaeon ex4484_58]|nr:MAG: hypothetical protein B6U89_00190 [Desulfurococcales archaeon ex4484_58]
MKKHLYFIDVNIRNRDLKIIIKKLRPYRKRQFTLYFLRNKTTNYVLVILGQIKIEYRERRIKDYLSGLTYPIREAIIKNYRREFIYIYWNKTHYRIKIMENPLMIKIVCSDPLDLLDKVDQAWKTI